MILRRKSRGLQSPVDPRKGSLEQKHITLQGAWSPHQRLSTGGAQVGKEKAPIHAGRQSVPYAGPPGQWSVPLTQVSMTGCPRDRWPEGPMVPTVRDATSRGQQGSSSVDMSALSPLSSQIPECLSRSVILSAPLPQLSAASLSTRWTAPSLSLHPSHNL